MITGLQSSSLYHFKLFAVNSGGAGKETDIIPVQMPVTGRQRPNTINGSYRVANCWEKLEIAFSTFQTWESLGFVSEVWNSLQRRRCYTY